MLFTEWLDDQMFNTLFDNEVKKVEKALLTLHLFDIVAQNRRDCPVGFPWLMEIRKSLDCEIEVGDVAFPIWEKMFENPPIQPLMPLFRRLTTELTADFCKFEKEKRELLTSFSTFIEQFISRGEVNYDQSDIYRRSPRTRDVKAAEVARKVFSIILNRLEYGDSFLKGFYKICEDMAGNASLGQLASKIIWKFIAQLQNVPEFMWKVKAAVPKRMRQTLVEIIQELMGQGVKTKADLMDRIHRMKLLVTPKEFHQAYHATISSPTSA